jgi:hypothetical protein
MYNAIIKHCFISLLLLFSRDSFINLLFRPAWKMTEEEKKMSHKTGSRKN